MGSSIASDARDAAPPSVQRAVLLGALLAAALGAVELAVRLGQPTPSEGRRALEILASVVGVHALGGAACGLLAGVLARVWSARAQPVLLAVPLFVLLAATALWFLGDVRAEEKPLWMAGRRYRYGALAAAGLVSFLAAVPLAALLLRVGVLRVLLVARRLALLSLVLVALAGALVLSRGAEAARREGFDAPRPDPEPFHGQVLPERWSAERGDTIAPGRPRHVLVVLVDTLRADALSCMGGPDGATPHTDRLAARGTLFEDVRAPASWTLPSVATLFTGVAPAVHGVGEFSGVVAGVSFVPLLADRYDATAFVGNPLVSSARRLDAGFRLFDMYDHAVEARLFLPNAPWELARLLGLVRYNDRRNLVLRFTAAPPFVDTRLPYYPLDGDLVRDLARFAPPEPGRPSLTYLHLAAPHDPYLASPLTFLKDRAEILERNLARVRELYADEVSRYDRALGEVLGHYEAAGVLDDTLVVVTSDHGEEFREHDGWTHGHTLYEEVVRVPLILAGPGIAAGRRVAERVELADVAPTLLSLCGVAPPAAMQGVDLTPLLRAEAGESVLPERHFAELTSQILNPGKRVFSAVQGRWKILREHQPDGRVTERAYDLEADPGERTPLETPDELAALRLALIDYEEAAVRTAAAELSEEERERMRALGYLDDGE